MSKHNLDAPLPPAKRQHILSSAGIGSRAPASLEAFSDELVISVFSHLDFVDLCHTQATCRSWSRLSLDNELWKVLYLSSFGGRTRLRGARGFYGRTDGREIKPLPERAASQARTAEDITKNWKWMFRISSNWRTGRCKVENLADIASQPSTSVLQADVGSATSEGHTHVLLAGSLTIIASKDSTLLPTIHLRSGNMHYHLAARSTMPGSLPRITSLALDQSPPQRQSIRLIACLSTSEILLFEVDLCQLSRSSCKISYVPSRRNVAHSPVVQAVYHHPLLVTLTESFSLALYDISDDTFVHTQSLSSFTSFPPSSLVLSRPTPATYKLVMAYSIPVYPAHWSVGATEVLIAGPAGAASHLPLSKEVLLSTVRPTSPPMTVTATRTTRALDIPQGWIDEAKLKSMRDQWSRKVKRVAETRTDGRWVVLAPGEGGERSGGTPSSSVSQALHSPTTLQLYKLSLPSSSANSVPKLGFVRSLYGQTGQISALSLSDGRCVGLSENGGIWVWDLEGSGPGARVAPSSSTMHVGKGSIVFDDRKIVSSDGGSPIVHVRRFDI